MPRAAACRPVKLLTCESKKRVHEQRLRQGQSAQHLYFRIILDQPGANDVDGDSHIWHSRIAHSGRSWTKLWKRCRTSGEALGAYGITKGSFPEVAAVAVSKDFG